MFIVIQTKEGDYIDLNTSIISYVKPYTTKKDWFYRIYVGISSVDITKEVYDDVLEPVLYPDGEGENP